MGLRDKYAYAIQIAKDVKMQGSADERDGKRPRPVFVDYKDLELLSKLVSRQGKIISRRKTGCTAASQHAVSAAIKRARFMALLPYVAD